ncbi:MAG: metallophosphoesterase, partial [Phycisphaerae bacterium]|nr:metallophosphoesterase [Phycisphaerae bacterium]
MSRYGIISDIHGNAHALRAVYEKLGALEVDRIVCLGDIVGYGPSPTKCLDLVL